MTIGHLSGAPNVLPRHDPVSALLRDLIHERIGIFFDDDKLPAMTEKLEPLIAALQCRSRLDYYYALKYGENAEAEWRRLMDAFSVQETYFWRELDQIRALVDHIVPAWAAKSAQPLRIWSAACASGDEPYSISIALEEAGWAGHPIEIIASDASQLALTRAREATYRERSFRSLPSALKSKYFERKGEGYTLDPRIRSRVTFLWANLVNLENLSATAAVDVIFCRNVFIYFSSNSIRRVLRSFSRRLPASGHLFVGASESLLKITDQFDLQNLGQSFVYVRNGTR
jgi:chemotaxis protein methyltransferase CheR